MCVCVCKCIKNVAQAAGKADICLSLCLCACVCVRRWLGLCHFWFGFQSICQNKYVCVRDKLHFGTFTLALQVRQATPTKVYECCWATLRVTAKVKCITRKCIAYTQAPHSHPCPHTVSRTRTKAKSTARDRAEPGPAPARGWLEGRWPTFTAIKCYETLKVLSESANEAHKTEAQIAMKCSKREAFRTIFAAAASASASAVGVPFNVVAISSVPVAFVVCF